MMICPETFYEYNLKGKNAEEILTVIRGIKREMGRLKNIMEHPEYVSMICPSEDVQISMSREYLQRAKQALDDVGGAYIKSKAELKVEEFENNIPYISKLVFSIGGCFCGNETYTVRLEEEHLRLWVSHSDIPVPSNLDIEQDYPMTKEEFLDGLKDLHIGEWRRNYNLKRFGYVVMDGTQWELEIEFNNGKKPVRVYGDNAYPYNFNKFQELLGIETYDIEDYEDDDE